jgi:hypothetical protein
MQSFPPCRLLLSKTVYTTANGSPTEKAQNDVLLPSALTLNAFTAPCSKHITPRTLVLTLALHALSRRDRVKDCAIHPIIRSGTAATTRQVTGNIHTFPIPSDRTSFMAHWTNLYLPPSTDLPGRCRSARGSSSIRSATNLAWLTFR